MLLRLLIVSLLLPISVFAQDGRVLEIRNFGGLNTIDNVFNVEPGDATRAYNVDFGRKRGSLSKRYGYDSLGVLSGVDSIINVFASYKSDGTQQLIYLVDPVDGSTPDSSGWGEIWASTNRGFGGGFIDSAYVLIDTAVANSIDTHTVYLRRNNSQCGSVVIAVSDTATAAQIVDSMVVILGALCPHTAVSNSGDTALLAVGQSNDGTSFNYVKNTSVQRDDVVVVTTQTTAPDKYFTKFPIQSEAWFAMFNDDIYITSPDGRGAVIHEGNGREFPFRAPGEILAIPLIDTFTTAVDSVYGLNGEYRYQIYFGIAGAIDSLFGGYVTDPLKIKNGKVLLDGFLKPQGDSANSLSGTDAISLYIYRTKANPGRLDYSDTVFVVDTLSLTFATDFDSLYYIDSVPDSLLGAGRRVLIDEKIGCDSLSTVFGYKYGAPSFLDFTYQTFNDSIGDTAKYGVFLGIPNQADTLGMVYTVTYIDTVTGIESDTSTSLYVWNDSTVRDASDSLPRTITIGLPRLPAGETGLVRNIYRGMAYQVTYDTGSFKTVYDNKVIVTGAFEWIERLAVDTVIVTDFFLAGQAPSSDSLFTDSIRWDSLSVKRRYNKGTQSKSMGNLFSYDGRMFGTYGSNLYFSRLDSAFSWGLFDFLAISPDDGDQITLAFPTQGGIVVCKNKRTFIAYKDSGGSWSLSELTGLPGCIAPRSYAKGAGGHYYLSDYGVVRLNDGQQLERRYQSGLVSGKLSNFEDLATTTKRSATAVYIPSSRQYLLNIGDTTYTYDERVDGWSTWGLDYSDATLYGSEDELDYIPGDTMYFIQQGDSTIYRFGTSERDNGSGVQVIWVSAPFGVDSRVEKISDLAIWWKNVGGVTINLDAYNEADTLLGLVQFSGTNRYIRKSYDNDNALYHRLVLTHSPASSIDSLSIDGIDVTIVDQGLRDIE